MSSSSATTGGGSSLPLSPLPPSNNSSQQSRRQLLSLLETCKSIRDFKQLHSRLIRSGELDHRSLFSSLSSNPGGIDYAREVFDKLPDRDVFLHNTMIKAYSDQNAPGSAISLYIELLNTGLQPNDYTFPFLLKSFNRNTAHVCGDELHAHVVKFGLCGNSFVQNALIHMYALRGDVITARELFDRCCKREVVMWNAMFSGYNKSKMYAESCELFHLMGKEDVMPNSITFLSVISACTKVKNLSLGMQIHSMINNDENVELSLSLQNALIDMYSTCGQVDYAWRLFDKMKEKDVISWTAMVVGFVNAGEVDRARSLFDVMPFRDQITWTAMINGYVRSNQFREALDVFREMQAVKIRPDEFTMASLLTGCAQLGSLGIGEWIRAYFDRSKIKRDITVDNALIDMYTKCGCIERAIEIFEMMQQKDKFTWTILITGLAVNGHGREALVLYSKMLKSSIKPDEITYIGVLLACTHAGFVERGRGHFLNMIVEHGIMPNVTHYGCLVDLLGRAGRLKEALETINNMPMRPNSVVWGAFLSACRTYKNINMAEFAANKIVEMDPENSVAYVVLANVYANSGKWEEVKKIRGLMMERGIKKQPGCSLIEMNGTVHEFVAGDRSHSQSDLIYTKLEEICEEIKLAGYAPDTSAVFPDIGEEEKENAVYRHSEKLAIAFGLVNSRAGTTIRVVKNLRMCADCHNAVKLISQVYARKIVVRDRTRFHHFRHGKCSCQEYW